MNLTPSTLHLSLSRARMLFACCLQDESGASLVEYSILLFALLGAIIGGYRYVGEALANAGHATSDMLKTK